MYYYPGQRTTDVNESYAIAPSVAQSGVAAVSYEVNGVAQKGIQISPTQIQPDNYPESPVVKIGTAHGEASKVIALEGGEFVDETGDRMTGTLDMSGNQIDNVKISEGTF